MIKLGKYVKRAHPRSFHICCNTVDGKYVADDACIMEDYPGDVVVVLGAPENENTCYRWKVMFRGKVYTFNGVSNKYWSDVYEYIGYVDDEEEIL
jgi:hypothetical protein